MRNILELEENRIYVESEKWSCHFGYGKSIKLGLVLEAVDMSRSSPDDEYSIVIDSYIIPWPEHLKDEILRQAREEGANTREELIRYIYECYGGVPVNIDAVQPAKASCGFSSFVAECNISSIEGPSGEKIEVRHFQDMEEALKFARDFYAISAQGLFGFIDLVLDNQLRPGVTGWDKIREIAEV